MSFSQMMPGDIFPLEVGVGHTETWEVKEVSVKDDTVDIKVQLVSSYVRSDNPVEERRKQLLEPHRSIRLEIPKEWK